MPSQFDKKIYLNFFSICVKAGGSGQSHENLSGVLRVIDSAFKDEIEAIQSAVEQNFQEVDGQSSVDSNELLVKIQCCLSAQDSLKPLCTKIALTVNNQLSVQQRDLFVQFLHELKDFPECTQEDLEICQRPKNSFVILPTAKVLCYEPRKFGASYHSS